MMIGSFCSDINDTSVETPRLANSNLIFLYNVLVLYDANMTHDVYNNC